MIDFVIHSATKLPDGSPAIVGLRLMRTDTGKFLDPADPTGGTWRDTAPLDLWEATPATRPLGPEAAGTPYASVKVFDSCHLASVPDLGIPDDVSVLVSYDFKAGQAGLAAGATISPKSLPLLVSANKPPEFPADLSAELRLGIPIGFSRTGK